MGSEITAPVIKLVSYVIWVTHRVVFSKIELGLSLASSTKKVQEFFFYPKTNLIEET